MAKQSLNWVRVASDEPGVDRFIKTIKCEAEYKAVKALQHELAAAKDVFETKASAAMLKAGKKPQPGCMFGYSYSFGILSIADDRPITGSRSGKGFFSLK